MTLLFGYWVFVCVKNVSVFKSLVVNFQDFKNSIQSCVRSRALIFGFLATAFEWYDYALFGYFAALIGQQFFPSEQPLTSILSSFAVFASGFAMRPLGAILFGYIGDRIGRKKALITSLIMMSIPTMALGFLPNYQSIGISASLGLVAIRLCQGLAVGGNYGGSFIYTIEHAQPKHKGLSGSLAMFGTLGGLFLGSGVATLLSAVMSTESLQAFGWRIPFMFGGVSAFIGYYIRDHLPELATQEQEEHDNHAPLKVIRKKYKSNTLKAIGMILLDGVGIYVLFVFMATYASLFLKLPQNQVLLANTITMTLLVITIPFFGWIGDKVTQKEILKVASLSFLFLPIPLFALLVYSPSLSSLLLLQFVFSIVMGAVYGALPAAVVSSFPHSVRYTACGLAFNISVAIFGGTAPFVITGLIQLTGQLMTPAFILTIVGMLAYISVLKSKFRYK